jgi:hypothetical protein
MSFYPSVRPHVSSLTPGCRIFFEKLTNTQLVKNSLSSLWNLKVHHRAYKIPPPNPILSQPNPVRPIDPYLSKVHFNIIFPPTPRSSQWSPPFGPLNPNPVNTLLSPMRATCPAYFVFLDLIILTIFGEE